MSKMTYLDRIEDRPASDDLIELLADSVRDRQTHIHPEPGRGADFYCLNLTSFMGERMGSVLARLRAAEAELKTLKSTSDSTSEEG